MRRQYQDDRLRFYIGDVRSLESVRYAMDGVSYVFHAAALKQVPSCEFFPLEAVKTNVLGTANVLTAAVDARVENVICLSTDKAAYPINAMGTSKAMEEKIAGAKARAARDTVISCTRYGNVMCSRGSVIPLFIEQVFEGGPITITNPEMTRFLMSLDEAVELVLFAFRNAKSGDLFVQKASACTIGDLAKAVQEIFKSKVQVEIIGNRHREKLYETLATTEELARAKEISSYFCIQADNRGLNYAKYYEDGSPRQEVEAYNSHNTTRLSVAQIVEKLKVLPYVRQALVEYEKNKTILS